MLRMIEFAKKYRALTLCFFAIIVSLNIGLFLFGRWWSHWYYDNEYRALDETLLIGGAAGVIFFIGWLYLTSRR